MSVGVFGPLSLDGASLSPRERAVLSALVLRAGRPVTTDELAEALWSDGLPDTWTKQLQASIGRVRAAIGRDAIETTPGAYRLRIDPDTVDTERFERFASSARRHLDEDPARALDAAERALALWRGSPYADLASWPPAVVEAERLDAVRMELEEVRLDARLRLGEAAASVADAERLVREAPLREGRWVLLATALYRSGRQADALAAIRAARERLADELGAEPGAELAQLELGILRHDDALEPGDAPASPSTTCPYRGLQPFGVEDEEDFFGRDADIDAALARIGRSHFLAVSGASGSGKSSLVRAGIVPALRRRGDEVVVLTPERDLDVRIKHAVWSGRTDVVVVDQFEEVFHAGEADVDSAARAIAQGVLTGTIVILVVRSDFLDDCAGHPDLAPLVAEGVHLVGPMAPASLREAIERPARRAGLRLESGLVELLLRDAAGEAGALPHLSHALVETWVRREGATLTVVGYEASGGISGAIAQSADRLYESMDVEQRVTCRHLLLRIVALAPDGSPIRRRVPSKALRADASREQVLSMLARSRLVTAEADSVQVAHESLATAWPRLRAWLEEDADGARILASVAAAADAWSSAGRPEDDLLRGARLQAAVDWRDAGPRDLTGVEREYLEASAARATAEVTQLEERSRRDRRQNRRLRTLLGVAAGLIVLLVGAGSVAVVASREASVQRDSASIEALVGSALALRTSERDVSALLAAEAYRRWPDDPRTRAGLMGVLQGAGGFLGNAVVADGGTAFGSLIPGTEQVLIVTNDGGAAVREAETGEVVRRLDLGFEPEWSQPRPLVEVSGDARIAAVLWPAETQPNGVAWYGTSPQSELIVFDLGSGERILGPTRLQAGTGALAINADGSVVAIADARDGRVSLVTPRDGRTRVVDGQVTIPLVPDSYAAALAFDADARLLVGRIDGRVEVVDPLSGTIARTLRVPGLAAHVDMTVVGSGMVIASGDRRLIAFDAASGRVVWDTAIPVPPPTPCNWLAASEQVERVYCGSLSGRISVFDLADGSPLPDEELAPLHGQVGSMHVSDDGTRLTTISGSHPIVSRMQLDGNGPSHRLVAAGRMVVGRYSFEDSSILTAPQLFGAESTDVWDDVSIIDTATGDIRYRFSEPVSRMVWTSGGRLHARFDAEEVFRTIDVASGRPVGEGVWNAASFWPSLDGSRLQVVRTDAKIQEYDPETGRAIGDSWGVEGFPRWLSESPDGSRLAVMYWNDGLNSETTDTMMHGERGEFLAIVDLEDDAHRILSTRPLDLKAQVLLDGGDLITLEDNRMGRFDTEPLSRSGTVPGAAGGLTFPTLSREARTLLVLASDDSAMLYDAPTGTRLGDPLRTDGRTRAISVLRPDGNEMAVSMPEGVVVWDLDPAHQFEYVCRIAGRDLTENEWRTYLGDLGDRQSTCGFDSAD
ncbi:BTAD domain-containing putative transcriptional regulator [Agromyces sp. NPDC056523]|uniref:nSTAND1 domain-containing NTPase n=1 Tax=Agromyces sp. NPDC056523 TaxID=3345850 RepID=UPI003671CD72